MIGTVCAKAESPPSDNPNDHELMRRVGQGDREALAVLVRRHQQKVLALAYRFLGDWAAAEDVCQDAFVRTFEAAASYGPTAAFTTWLYRVVANLCWDRRRRAARDPGPLPSEAGQAAAPNTALEDRERVARVREAVARLSDRQRLALILHRFAGLPHKEISQITGWSRSAVESCLARAYSRLRTLLADLEGD